jgi:predicted  nucleic acid-binding Zn-ribbon protein
MRQAALERRIRDLQRRVRVAREELAVLDEQIETLGEEAEEARMRWLVAETPLAEKESSQAGRHLDLAVRARDAVRAEIEQCVADRDRYLAEFSLPGRQ